VGRHWLDLARYADSDGYEKDKPRFVWAYRDWVINSLNRDLPYDQFIVEQLAGDLLPNATQDQVVRHGLPAQLDDQRGGRRGPRTVPHGRHVRPHGRRRQGRPRPDHPVRPVPRPQVDPLTQKEYYRIFAFLNNDHEANVTVYTAEEQKKRADVLGKIREVEDEIKSKAPDWRKRMDAWEEKAKAGRAEWVVIRPEVEGETTGGQKYLPQADGSFSLPGLRTDKAHGQAQGEDGREERDRLRLELLNDLNLPRGGPGRSIKGTAALN